MIARLTYNPGTVIVQDEGSILIRLDYDDDNYAPACQITTAMIHTPDDFEECTCKHRTIYIGPRGGNRTGQNLTDARIPLTCFWSKQNEHVFQRTP